MMMNAAAVEDMADGLQASASKIRSSAWSKLKSWVTAPEFRTFLDEETQKVGFVREPLPWTWPGVVGAYIRCIDLHWSPRKNYKIDYARLLHSLILKASKGVPLRPVVTKLYQHILTVLKTANLNKTECENLYCDVLAWILSREEYRLRISYDMYAEFFRLLVGKNPDMMRQSNVYKAMLALMQQAPRPLDDEIRAEIVSAFVALFRRDIGHGGEYLSFALDSMIGFFLHEGPNVGPDLSNIDAAASGRLYTSYTMVSGNTFKDVQERIMLYFRIALNLRAYVPEDEARFGGVLELTLNELDGKSWVEDLTGTQLAVLRLAAKLFYELHKRGSSEPVYRKVTPIGPNKRRKTESIDTDAALRNQVTEGKVSWVAAACFLLKLYGNRLRPKLLSDLITSSATCLDKLTKESIDTDLRRNFQAPLWQLKFLCRALLLGVEDILHDKALWQSVWDAVSRRMTMFSAVPLLLDEALVLLGYMLTMTDVADHFLPTEFWTLPLFKEAPTRNAVFFVASYFCYSGPQVPNLQLRKDLMRWCFAGRGILPPKLLSGALLILSGGNIRWSPSEMTAGLCSPVEARDIVDDAEIDQAEEILADATLTKVQSCRMCKVPLTDCSGLLEELGEILLQPVDTTKSLHILFRASAVMLYCYSGASVTNRTVTSETWTATGRVLRHANSVVRACATKLEEVNSFTECIENLNNDSVEAIGDLVSAFASMETSAGLGDVLEATAKLIENLMDANFPALAPTRTPLEEDELGKVVRDGRPKPYSWKSHAVSFLHRIGELLPDPAMAVLREVADGEKNAEVHGETVLSMCNIVRGPDGLSDLIKHVEKLFEGEWISDSAYRRALSALHLVVKKVDFNNGVLKEQLFDVVDKAIDVNFRTWELRVMFGEILATITFQTTEYADTLLKRFSDPDFRVRVSMARHMPVMFKYENHGAIFDELCNNLNVKIPTATSHRLITASECATSKRGAWTKSALLCLGEVAISSENAEAEAVFMILAQAALEPIHRKLAAVILDKVAKRLGYSGRWKYMEQLLGGVICRWVITEMPMAKLLEIEDILVPANTLLQSCLPLILSHLIYNAKKDELQWLSQATSSTIRSLVIEHFGPVVANILALDPGDSDFEEVAEGFVMNNSGLPAGDWHDLLKENMVSVVSQILLLVDSAVVGDRVPHTSCKNLLKDRATKMVGELYQETFPPGSVLEMLLLLHSRISDACGFRHRRDCMAKMTALVSIAGETVTDPSIFRYLLHIILQLLDVCELQNDCCELISEVVKKLEDPAANQPSWVLGDQLQALISKLVFCIGESPADQSQVMALLRRFTVDSDPSLHPFLKDIDPFSNTPCFEPMRTWQAQLNSDSTFSARLVKFVQRAPYLSSPQLFRSLQLFCQELRDHPQSALSDEVVVAIWDLVLLCNEEGEFDIRQLTAELLTAAGIANPHAVVFELPEVTAKPRTAQNLSLDPKQGISEDIAKRVLVQVCHGLLNQDAGVVKLALKAAKGLLSTEKGVAAYDNMSAPEKAYLEVHSKGVDPNVVNTMLNNTQPTYTNAKLVDDASLWVTDGKTYNVWICNLVFTLIECTQDPFLRLCQDLVLRKASISELLLPHVLGFLSGKLKTNSKAYADIVSQVRTHILGEANKNTRSVQVFLEALNSLRFCYVKACEKGSPLPWPKVYWLDIDYLVTARAAEKCAAYFSSMLYTELWCEDQFGGERLTLGVSQYDDSDELPEHLDLMLTICTSINEPDSAYGVVRNHKLSSRIRIHEHEGDFGKAVQTYDLLLRNATPEQSIKYYNGMVKALYQEGGHQLNDKLCLGLVKTNVDVLQDKEFRELQYESAWRHGKWDFNISDLTAESMHLQESGFDTRLHRSFKCLLDGDAIRFPMYIKEVQVGLVSHVMHTSLESTQNVYPAIARLQAIKSLKDAWNLRWPPGSLHPVVPDDDKVGEISNVLGEMLDDRKFSYKLLEPFNAFLVVLLRVLQREDQIPNRLVQRSLVARKSGKLNHAANAIYELQTFFDRRPDLKTARRTTNIRIEEAKVLVAQGEPDMAIKLLHHLLEDKKNSHLERSELNRLKARWLAKNKSGRSDEIDWSFKGAVDGGARAMKEKTSSDTVRALTKAYFRYAQFADSACQTYEDLFASSEWTTAIEWRNYRQKELDFYIQKAEDPNLKEDDKAAIARRGYTMKQELNIDRNEHNAMKKRRTELLKACLKNYKYCLRTGNHYDHRVIFRLVWLWFRPTPDPEMLAEMLAGMKDTATNVPSGKFIPLVYQIASRMGPSSNDLASIVSLLVTRMATEHPYHTIYQLIALANSDRVKVDQKSKEHFVYDNEKKLAAEAVLKGLKNVELVKQVKQMVEMYIRMAEMPRRKDWDHVDIPRDIRNVKQLALVPVITANLEIDWNCKYSEKSFPYFMGFVDRLQVMNGVNAPKVVICQGSDGQRYRQLVKSGDDDLRQDAVMEQLFGLVNNLLASDPETRRRHLQMRTYKVIPFSPSAGALEWVEGTMPLSEYLIGKTGGDGAHSRYRPKDKSFMSCRKDIMQDKINKSDVFKDICTKFSPVMRYFFRERCKQPADWFKKRLAYTRSVATSSMVGYVIGLGDRHTMNILLDKETAEVVHIDLGIAFEQGLMLRTPETVPFRLTRDIVDGMGVTGVEGVFRRCCEQTLSVLQANRDALLTIIEVFIHDPLYKWALSPLQALRKQTKQDVGDPNAADDDPELDASMSKFGNKDAARALFRVKQKLDGYEGNELMSVQGQVQKLIADAQDPERLCKLFPGWAAWV